MEEIKNKIINLLNENPDLISQWLSQQIRQILESEDESICN